MVQRNPPSVLHRGASSNSSHFCECRYSNINTVFRGQVCRHICAAESRALKR
ncbi:hypothetical protein [Agrobacterium tumefaciens]|uniref:hypothetical protein n=1 Tax=Agrobacterium tumefaciens TaxID=358 RepID=UPI003AF4C5E2